LEPGEADVVDANLPEDRPGQVAVGVEAPGLVEEVDAGQLERGDGVGDLVIDLAGDVGEVEVRAAEAAGEVRDRLGVEREGPGEGARHRRGVLDEPGVGPDGLVRQAHREVVAVAIEDRAPVGREGDALEALRGTELGVLLTPDGLDVHEAHDDRPEAHEEADQRDAEPASRPPRPGAGRDRWTGPRPPGLRSGRAPGAELPRLRPGAGARGGGSPAARWGPGGPRRRHGAVSRRGFTVPQVLDGPLAAPAVMAGASAPASGPAAWGWR